MNEFIVWYEKPNRDRYSREYTLNQLIEGCHFDEICDCPIAKLDKIIGNPLRYIGKTDINDKKIYADCSLVEFLFIKDINNQKKLKGWFTWNDIDLRYEIDMLEGQLPYFCLYYNEQTMFNFKIIDTLQENKLNLFEEKK